MKLPLSWLNDYVTLEVDAAELGELLTYAGLEVEATHVHGRPALARGFELAPDHLDWAGIVVGELVEVKPHPNADRLLIAIVDYGDGPKQSVTGAPNLKVGDRGLRVAAAAAGAQIVNAYSNDPARVQVKPAKLRGERSEVVLCSEKELGLSDDHKGILLLDADAPVGTPLSEVLGDVVFEFDLTPNLARCMNVVGVARETAALCGARFAAEEPSWTAEGPPIEGRVEVEIDDPALCARYTAAAVRGVEIKRAPHWMRHRLTLAGMRPINNIVDVTNYVMLEWGQPLHAFDYAKVRSQQGGAGPYIRVRRAEAGETLTTLDEQARRLDPDMLLITDGEGPIALAGVMGGLESEVGPHTTDILLESANFAPANNRRTAQRLKLFSEASARFSRGLPPELAEHGLKRAAELMRAWAGGTIDRGFVDAYPRKPKPTVVSLPASEPERLLGVRLAPEEIAEHLRPLGFACEVSAEQIEVTAPYYRLDVERPADLVEEVARMVGYDRLPVRLLADVLPPQRRNRDEEGARRVRRALTQLGLTEAINYALTHPSVPARLAPDGRPDAPEAFVCLANPLSQDRSVMRRALLPGLLECAAANSRFQARVALFELGRVYLPAEGEPLPHEPVRLGLVLWGRREEASWLAEEGEMDFFDLKGAVEGLLDTLGLAGARVERDAHPSFHPGRCARLDMDGTAVGYFGELHPRAAEAFELAGRTCAAEFELAPLLAGMREHGAYCPLPRYPAVAQDLALVVTDDVPAREVETRIRELGAPLLSALTLFDVYTGAPVPKGKRSLAYNLTYQAPDRTLTDDEVQRVHGKIVAGLQSAFDAQVRGVDG